MAVTYIYGQKMQAIQKLRRAGLTTSQIAQGIGDKSGGHLVRAYERGERFPSRKTFVCIVELADSRGLTLLARDFIPEDVACEENEKE